MKNLFRKRYRHLHRYRDVANVLAKYGLGLLVDQLNLKELISRKEQGGELVEKMSVPQRVRDVLAELGPTFIKLGQILSTRPDLIPHDYVREFEKLQDQVPPFASEIAEKLIQTELGKPVIEMFSGFDPSPIGSASIGQVHRARLKSGEEVIIKAQRPDINNVIETDLEILFDLARILESRTAWGKIYRLVDVVEEFAGAIREEMDYTLEGRNADRFRKNFTDDNNVVIPRVYWEFTTRRIMVMEYVAAVKISDLSGLAQAGYDPVRIARRVVEAMLKQAFVDGFYHADPHPGNLGVLPGNRIVFMDFGQVGRIDELTRDRFINLILAVIRQDAAGIVRNLLQIGVVGSEVNSRDLQKDVSRMMSKYYDLPLSKIRLGDTLGELFDLALHYQVRLPADVTLLAKASVTLEGLITRLDPELSFFDLAQAYGKRLLRQRLSPERLRKALTHNLYELGTILTNLPRQLENLLHQAGEGEFKIQLEHRNLQRAANKISLVGNRVSLAILIGSIIIGSSLIARQSSNSLLNGLPLAEIGFFVAVFLGFWLVISIIRTGRY